MSRRISLLLILALTAIFSICTLASAAPIVNNRPIIAVLAQPYHHDENAIPHASVRVKDPSKHSYIAASYVKYLESSGARVVPLLYDTPAEEMREILSSVNGVLFPGGGTPLDNTTYLDVQRQIMEYAVQRFDHDNVYFPIWATCLGFEAAVIVTASNGYDSMYNHLDSWNISMPLDVTPAAQQSRLFSGMSQDLFSAIQKSPITMNNHHSGFRTEDFMADNKLTSFWSVLSVNKDRSGVDFISTIESKRYPIYAVQWHPEKNSFEWTVREGIVHTPEAIDMTQYFSNFFVNEARKNNQQFSSMERENKALIYNYNPEFTYLEGSDFQQCYFFNPSQ